MPMLDGWIEIIVYSIFIATLIAYCAYVRFAPMRTSTPKWLDQHFNKCLINDRFRRLQAQICNLNSEQQVDVHIMLYNDSSRNHFSVRSAIFYFFGGLARYQETDENSPSDSRRIEVFTMNLGWFPWLIAACTTHELIHAIRHIQGRTIFEDEAKMTGFVGFIQRCFEEAIVWMKTVYVRPFGTFALGSFFIFHLLGLPFGFYC
jgi:hypothetical protein